MTVTWPVTISYPTGLDTFYAGSPLADGVDQVIDNHPNTIAKSIVALETKLGITGGITSGLGALAFFATGLAANPMAGTPNIPTVWVNTSQELIYSVSGVDINIGTGGVGAGTTGEIITWDGAGAETTVAVGTATHILTSNGVGVEPTFQAISTHAEVTLATSATTGGMSISTQEIGNQAATGGTTVAASLTNIGSTGSPSIRATTWDAVLGTWWSSGDYVKQVFRYDGSSSWTTFTNSSDTATGRYRYHVWHNGELWTGAANNPGGADRVWSYDPGTDTWTGHGGRSTVVVPGTFGIWDSTVVVSSAYGYVHKWDSGSTWISLGNPAAVRALFPTDVSGTLYVTSNSNDVYEYSGSGTTWTDLSVPMPAEYIADWNGVLVAACLDSGKPVVYKYEASTWTKLGGDLSPLTHAFFFFLCSDSLGTLYAIPSSVSNPSIYKYDSALDSWSTDTSVPVGSGIPVFSGEFNPTDAASFGVDDHIDIFQPAYTDPVNGYLTSVDWTTFNNKADAPVYAENLDIDTGIIETVDSFNPTDDGTILWTYHISDDATNMRCGTIMAVWDDSAGTVDSVESTTAELGSTAAVVLSVDYDTSLVRLRALPTGSSNWKVRVNRVSKFEV